MERETDSNGEATFDVDEGDYTVSVSHSEFESATTSVSLDADETLTETVTITSLEQGTIQIIVEPDDADVIEDAEVELSGEGRLAQQTTGSDSSVTFENVTPGTYTITVTAGGYDDASATVSIDWAEDIEEHIPIESSDEPTLVDDFDRTSIDPWENTHDTNDVGITTDVDFAPGNGLEVIEASSAEVHSGLENFPAAGGGPNNDGAWEAHVRVDSWGGTSDIVRLEFAVSDNDHLRWQLENDTISIRHGSDWEWQLPVSTDPGDVRILRVNEWDSSGYMDISAHDEGGTQLAREDNTFGAGSGAPTDGGLAAWTNFSSEFTVGLLQLID